LLKNIYRLRNLIINKPEFHFISSKPDEDCIARLSFQLYPKGIGELNKHQDPLGYHQLTVPLFFLSKKGVDFKEGCLYVEKENGF
jgi:hypothetical protein|tara:strand:+ start:628 stop:882 length:255 start_codon:yes stop_codon:yes gene_type:complete